MQPAVAPALQTPRTHTHRTRSDAECLGHATSPLFGSHAHNLQPCTTPTQTTKARQAPLDPFFAPFPLPSLSYQQQQRTIRIESALDPPSTGRATPRRTPYRFLYVPHIHRLPCSTPQLASPRRDPCFRRLFLSYSDLCIVHILRPLPLQLPALLHGETAFLFLLLPPPSPSSSSPPLAAFHALTLRPRTTHHVGDILVQRLA